LKKLELLGKRYGKLVVLEFAGLNKYKIPHRMWRCRCDCGREVIKSGPRLYSGKINSCGCLNLEHMRSIPKETRLRNLEKAKPLLVKIGSAMRELFGDYKFNARRRHLEWGLSAEEFVRLTSAPCYYTGRAPSAKKVAYSGEVYNYNGIDRLDSSRGYTLDNCVPCCAEINRMKWEMSVSDFIKFCSDVHRMHGMEALPN
jgi:hypothetical protein